MLLSITGRGGLARGRLLNRHPPALQQNVRVSVFADSSKSAAGASTSSRSQRGYGSLKFTHQVSSAVPPVVSVAPPSVIPPGSAFATAAVPKRSALVTDPKLETIRREVAQLALQELQVRTKQEWNFGSQFLEKYGYQWEESEDGEVVLTRDINRQRVRIRFALTDQNTDQEEGDDRDIVDAEPDPNAKPQNKEEQDELSYKGKPMAIQVSRIDLKGKEVATVVFYCQCGPDNSIIVDGVGGEETESWGLKFDSLSPMLKDKIIDFLCELEIAGDVSKYVREYTANLGETNVSSINRLHQFFSTDEK